MNLLYRWKGTIEERFMECLDRQGRQVAYIEVDQTCVSWWVSGMEQQADETCAACDGDSSGWHRWEG